jgi:hypothetical protein
MRFFKGFSVLLVIAGGVTAGTPAVDPGRLVADAQAQVGVTTGYDPAYRALAYPGGDVPPETGVCTDVVVRAFRRQGVDLQKAVHEDMRANFQVYPKRWGLSAPDPNIDHRRVPNLQTWFRRQGWAVAVTPNPADFRPGDLVSWDLGRGIPHIGIVSDRRTPGGVPLVIHNIGEGAKEEDILFAYTVTGHFRVRR